MAYQMVAVEHGSVSFAFGALQELSKSFDSLPSRGGSDRSKPRLRKLASDLGSVAIPSLLRRLANDAIGAAWAAELLVCVARADDARAAAIAALDELCKDDGAGDTAKLRASSLLAELTGNLCTTPPVFADPEGSASHSLALLAQCLDSRHAVADAADWLLVDMEDAELAEFVDDLRRHDPRSAALVLDELLLRHDLGSQSRGLLVALAAELAAIARPDFSSSNRRSTIVHARHASGHQAIIASARMPRSSPLRWRALSLLIDADDNLVEACYTDEATRSQMRQSMLQPLHDNGFEIITSNRRDAKELALRAARRRLRAGHALTRGFYLGRDLLGIDDELREDSPGFQSTNAALLARATELMQSQRHAPAVPLLRLLVERCPENAEGAEALSLCLHVLGEREQARRLALRACFLEPANARYHWNRASLAHRADRRSECYLALCDYMKCRDDSNPARRGFALRFIADYERRSRLSHPGLPPIEVALRDEGSAKSAARARK